METQRFDKRYANRAMLLFAAFSFVVLYIETMLIPSLPSIAAEYKVDAAAASLLVSLYLVSGVALSPIIGKLGDIYGKKRVLTYILPVYVVAVGVTGFAPNFTFILISRTIQGIGLTIFPLMISLVQEEFPRDMIPRALSIIMAMFGIGSAIGLPLGSFVSNSFGWQFCYHTALPFVILIVALILYYIRESKYKRPDVRIDYVGAVTLAFSLSMIIMALSEGSTYGWTSVPILFMGSVGLLLLIPFALYEKRVKEPIFDSKLMSMKNVLIANVITFFSGLVFFFSYQAFSYLFGSPAPLGFGYDIFRTGISLVPFAIVNAIAAPVLGKYIPRFGVKPFFLVGSVIAVAGFVLASAAFTPNMEMLSEFIGGLGTALVAVPTINLLVLSIKGEEMGIATSMNSVFRFLGSSLGAPFAGLLIATYESRVAFQYSFYLAIVCMIAVLVASLFADEILGHGRRIEELEGQVSI